MGPGFLHFNKSAPDDSNMQLGLKIPRRVKPLQYFSLALASVAQWVGVLSCRQKVMGSIPSQGMYPDCGFDPWLGSVREGS